MNCYEILEVSQNASPEVIKAAYKSLMQRYHPDKNPDNAEIAGHALKVAQAYKVLSDPSLRAAHDIKLKQPLADNLLARRDNGRNIRASSVAYDDFQLGKKKPPYWLLWLLIVLIIALCLYAMVSLRKTPVDNNLSTGPEIQKKEASEGIQEALPKTIAAYISDLTVTLKEPDEFAGGAVHVLNIPVLGVKIGAFDENKMRHYIDDNKILIRQRLEERLEDAKYESLIKFDGEQYLKNIVLDSIGDTTGANQYKADPLNAAQAGQYGVVDVLLPRSFSVH